MNPFRLLSLVRLLVASVVGAMCVCAVTGCGSAAVPAPWQVDAKSAMDRATTAYLEGDGRSAEVEMMRVRRAISATARADLWAQAELAFCAAHIASLVLQPCAAFDALRADATPAQRAYADYLMGRIEPTTVALLPPHPQKIARLAPGDAVLLAAQPEPLTRLVGAALWLQQGHANAAVYDVAIDTASQQGWRRALLAWLGAKLVHAQQAGDVDEAERLRRRMGLASTAAAPAY